MTKPARKTNRPEATKWQKKQIHWAAAKLGYDDEARQAMCWGVTGKWSTTEMTPTEAAQVVRECVSRLKAAGLPIPWRTPSPTKPGRKPNPRFTWEPDWLKVREVRAKSMASYDQLVIIRDRWVTLGRRGFYDPAKPQEALDGFLRKRFGLEKSIQDLDTFSARKIISVLMEMTDRPTQKPKRAKRGSR